MNVASLSLSTTSGDVEWINDPNKIHSILRELVRVRARLHIFPVSSHEVKSRLLQVDFTSRTCVLDWCSDGVELEAMLNASELSVSAFLGDANFRFRLATPRIFRFQEKPAFLVPVPTEFCQVPGRRHFRARLPAGGGFRCEIQLSDNPLVALDIEDISVSGIGLSSTAVSAQQMLAGPRVKPCSLHLGDLISLDLALQVVRHRRLREGSITVNHFGCTFCRIDGKTEKLLQRLVFTFELTHRQ
ncbi:flagellar brake protein [Cupriavidus necator]|uniref:Flagellar brake protein YcgR n=1 Tax=Cupriavidus necator TaxID=106590 RepID=A0A367PH95_CUPNE|nr:flagellar brake protein [Cupriavidus necator]QQX86694.1 flagellar brake protein [Cupriavidus necator]RCJ07230.1 hypothetical protein DDK22_17630 [Cupriavidus necator]